MSISLYYCRAMPIYEYECDKCETVIERIQKFSDAPLTTCETCGGPLDKLISKSAFQLKGDGWYVTDYAQKDTGKESGGTEAGEKKKTKTVATESSSNGGDKAESKSESTKSPDTGSKDAGGSGSKDK